METDPRPSHCIIVPGEAPAYPHIRVVGVADNDAAFVIKGALKELGLAERYSHHEQDGELWVELRRPFHELGLKERRTLMGIVNPQHPLVAADLELRAVRDRGDWVPIAIVDVHGLWEDFKPLSLLDGWPRHRPVAELQGTRSVRGVATETGVRLSALLDGCERGPILEHLRTLLAHFKIYSALRPRLTVGVNDPDEVHLWMSGD